MPFAELHEESKVTGIGKYLAAGRVLVNVFGSAIIGSVVDVDTKHAGFLPSVHEVENGFSLIVPDHGYRIFLHQRRV